MMNGNEPYWYKLISFWVKKKRRTGLTIPFVIGAKSFFDSKLETIPELLHGIKNSNINEIIILYPCTNVGEYVLGLNDQPYSMSGKEFKNDLTGKMTLIVTSGITQIYGNKLNTLANALEKKYRECLANKTYSREKNQWIAFTEFDIKLINDAKNQ